MNPVETPTLFALTPAERELIARALAELPLAMTDRHEAPRRDLLRRLILLERELERAGNPAPDPIRASGTSPSSKEPPP